MLQPRLEATRAGRAVVTVLCVALLVGLFVTGLPSSALTRELGPLVGPYITPSGLDTNWEVFAPDPRRVSLEVYADIEFADGRVLRWSAPDAGPFIGTYRRYRWRKWVENVRADANSELWRPTARWLAARHADHGSVTRVRLVRRWRDIPAPGSDAQPDWRSFEFFVLEVGA